MQDNRPAKLANIRMLQFVATKLGKLCDELVFLGGCTTALFIDEPQSPDVRYTLDVDCIVDVISLNEYHRLESKLKNIGFKQSVSEEVICRWYYDDVILDVMPTDEKILGFSNRWYKEAIKNSKTYSLGDGINIQVVTAPYFLATKLEAFNTRGKKDFYASRDFEDIISILDGRSIISNEISSANRELKEYLIQQFAGINSSPGFKGAMPGHFVQYGNLAEDRMEMLENKIALILQG